MNMKICFHSVVSLPRQVHVQLRIKTFVIRVENAMYALFVHIT